MLLKKKIKIKNKAKNNIPVKKKQTKKNNTVSSFRSLAGRSDGRECEIDSLRKQPFLPAPRRLGRFAGRDVQQAARSKEEKRLFSQATKWRTEGKKAEEKKRKREGNLLP